MGYSPQGRKESDTTERLHFKRLCSCCPCGLTGDEFVSLLRFFVCLFFSIFDLFEQGMYFMTTFRGPRE